MAKKYVFVEHSKGEMEGTLYNNISLSNGIRTAVVKNKTGIADEVLATLEEGDEVLPTFEVKIVKGQNRTSVFAIELIKMEFPTKPTSNK